MSSAGGHKPLPASGRQFRPPTLPQFCPASWVASRVTALGERSHGHQGVSGFLQNFYNLLGILQRVHRYVGEKLCANHGGREAAQVNSLFGKLLSQLRGNARPVTA